MANKEEKNVKTENTLVHDTIALTLITLIAGVLLGGVYTMTKDPIKKQNDIKKAEAYAAVYKDAEFVEDKAVTDSLEDFNDSLAAGDISKGGSSLSDVEVTEVMVAQVDGNAAGYVLTCQAKGYGGSVVLAMGIDAEGAIQGIQITDCSNETPGLGQNSSKADWNGQYVGMDTTQEVTVVKDGTGSTEDGSINAITGATITSSAVTRAVNGALAFIASLSE